MIDSGVVLTLWRGDSMSKVLTDWTKELILKAEPRAVCIHAGPERLLGSCAGTAKIVRDLGVSEIHLGLGCDYWVGEACKGRLSEAKAVEHILDGVELALGVDAEAVIFDLEGKAKLDSLVSSRIVKEVVKRSREMAPYIYFGATAYDQPTQHADDKDGDYDDDRRKEFPWRAFLGRRQLPWYVAQTYVVPEKGDAAEGALKARIARHRASWAVAVSLGWISPDVEVDAYFQAYKTPTQDLVANGTEFDRVYFWCGPELPNGRMDERGAEALRLLCEMERAKIRRAEGLKIFQAEQGLKADGILGDKTFAAICNAFPKT